MGEGVGGGHPAGSHRCGHAEVCGDPVADVAAAVGHPDAAPVELGELSQQQALLAADPLVALADRGDEPCGGADRSSRLLQEARPDKSIIRTYVR